MTCILFLCAAALRVSWPLGSISNANCPYALLAERVGMYCGQGISTIINIQPRLPETAAASSAALDVIVGHDGLLYRCE